MTKSQRMTIIMVIALVFVVTGILKLLNNVREIAQFTHYGLPLWFMYFTAVINILAGIGLIFKKTFLVSALSLLTLLILSIVNILIHHDSVVLLLQPIVVLLCLLILIWGSRST